MNDEEDFCEPEQRAETSMLVRAWAEGPHPSDVRAQVTSVATDERRMAGSLGAMHQLIDEILAESNIISTSINPSSSEGRA